MDFSYKAANLPRASFSFRSSFKSFVTLASSPHLSLAAIYVPRLSHVNGSSTFCLNVGIESSSLVTFQTIVLKKVFSWRICRKSSSLVEPQHVRNDSTFAPRKICDRHLVSVSIVPILCCIFSGRAIDIKFAPALLSTRQLASKETLVKEALNMDDCGDEHM